VTLILSILLLVNAVFGVTVWPTFYRRVANDTRARDAAGNPTKFLTVHRVIIGIALLIAGISAVFGILGLVLR
jgi:hypothetical protein